MKIYKNNIFIKLLFVKIILLSFAAMSYFGITKMKENFVFAEKKDTSIKTNQENKNETTTATKNSKESVEKQGYLDGILTPPKLELSDTNEKLQDYLNRAQATQKQLKIRMDLLEKKSQFLKDLEKTIDEKIAELEERRLFLLTTLQKKRKYKKTGLIFLLNSILKWNLKKQLYHAKIWTKTLS